LLDELLRGVIALCGALLKPVDLRLLRRTLQARL
jgi:hypothetical protein